MKKIQRCCLFLVAVLMVNGKSYAQVKHIGLNGDEFTGKNFSQRYYPKLHIEDDTLYASTLSGVYKKVLTQQNDWEAYAFKGIPVIEFVKNENQLLAISTGVNNSSDSLLLRSKDGGKTIENLKPEGLIANGTNINMMCRIVQNPDNKNSVLVSNPYIGLYRSPDFGDNWNCLSTGCLEWYTGFHPLDTATIFYAGETFVFSGMIVKSVNNGRDWSTYTHPGGDNSVHDIAYHPTNPDILFYSGEGFIGKSIDKGETWDLTDLRNTGMYFFKIIFDTNNPDILYATGVNGNATFKGNTLSVYRSTDLGNTWSLAYEEDMEYDYCQITDMVSYKDKLIFLTRYDGVYELDVDKMQLVANEKINIVPDIEIYQEPSSGRIQFKSEVKIHAVEIVDLTGKTAKRVTLSDQDSHIDTSSLSKGIYLLTFYTDKQPVTKKIMVAE
jgi:photosystem II stability/assembly factor-like uncharacterized protein